VFGPGNAGANTTSDHLDVLAAAIAQIPAQHHRRLLIRGDSTAGTHAVLDWLTGLNTCRRRRVLDRLVDRRTGARHGGVREKAKVAELTGLLTLPGWPDGMRVIVRRERPRGGAQLTLFEEGDAASGGRRPVCAWRPRSLRANAAATRACR
jgi:hypothetical protein